MSNRNRDKQRDRQTDRQRDRQVYQAHAHTGDTLQSESSCKECLTILPQSHCSVTDH